MVMLGTLDTDYLTPAQVSTMPEPLALEAAPGVRGVRWDGATGEACVDVI